jgi:type IV pilus assembly protein PilN|tara:strand:- start:2295 stop:3947 length:1653 start_codon:yes stop_codon:yes gene_type:complete
MLKKIIKIIVGYLSKLTVEQEEVVGIDITPNCIRIAQLESTKKEWTLTKLGYKYIDGSSNYSIVENPELYVNKLTQLIASSKIKTKSAAVSIPVSSAIIKVVPLPLMTDEELKVAVASDSLWENAVQLADNLDEYSIFWQVLKRDTAENQMHLLFVASKLDDIDNYLDIVRQSGLNPVVVDVRCFATRNALALRADLTKSSAPVAIVEFGAFENYILILYQDSPFISDIYLSEKDRSTLMNQESTDAEIKGISNRFSMQVAQMISSYTAKYKTQAIDTLLISSSMPNIERTIGNFNDALPNINVDVFDPLLNSVVPENLQEKSKAELNSSIFSSALGLATRKLDVFGYYEYVTGTNNINLLPNRENVKSQEKMKFLSRWGVVVFVIAAIAFGAWNFLLNGKEVDRVDALMVEFNQLEPLRNELQMTLSDLLDKKDSLEMTLEATNELTSNQGFMYSVLVGINAAIPSSYIKLTEIDYFGGNKIIINGMSANDNNILSFIENLTIVDVIDKASLSTMSAETISNQAIKKFVVEVILIEQQTIDGREDSDGN